MYVYRWLLWEVHNPNDNLSAVIGSHVVVYVAQFWVDATTVFIAVDGVSAKSPWLSVTPVATVRARAAEVVPVATVIVDDAPEVPDVITKALKVLL
jgi:hypothetical protein